MKVGKRLVGKGGRQVRLIEVGEIIGNKIKVVIMHYIYVKLSKNKFN